MFTKKKQATKNQQKSMKSTINLINLFVGGEIVIHPHFPYFFYEFKMFKQKQKGEGIKKFSFFRAHNLRNFFYGERVEGIKVFYSAIFHLSFRL